MWEVEYTDQFGAWWSSLQQMEQASVEAAVNALQRDGPALGRPLADTIKGSRYRNLKELRPLRGNLRILFMFDPRRTAILLLGGDKTNQWETWYQQAIPLAEQLYDEYLEEIRREGELK
jgi:hypothetical protein